MNRRALMVMGVFAVIVLIGISFFLYFRYKNSASQGISYSYVIPDVPYYNVLNGTRFSDTAAALFSILQYWGDTSTDPIALSDAYPNSGSYTTDQIAAYFQSKGLNAQRIQLKTIDNLKTYINKDAETPLLVFQSPNVSSPFQPFGRRARVVIGLDDAAKMVIVHDYWLGNNFTISYDDFLQLSATFMAVSPKQQMNISRTHVDYPQISGNERDMLAACMIYYFYYLKTISSPFTSSSTVNAFFQTNLLNNPDFLNMPPVFKVLVYIREGASLLKIKDYDGAIQAFTEAASYNHDLNKPSGIWPAVLYTTNGRLYNPYYWLGLTYMAESNTVLAKKNFEEALSINPAPDPSSKIIQTVLESLQ